MIKHQDEILLPAVSSDRTAVPRYDVVAPDGQTIYKNVALKLANDVAQSGTPINKPLLDEFLAASGITAGSATAYTLAQEGYSLFDGAPVRFRLHTASGGNATLNINGTGAKPLRDVLGETMNEGIPAGTWLTANYSAASDAYIIGGGGGVASNPNLLDNWYFGDPVNQRNGYVVKQGTNFFAEPSLTTYLGGIQEPYLKAYYDTSEYGHIIGSDGSTAYVRTSDMIHGYTGEGYAIDRWKSSGALVCNDGYITHTPSQWWESIWQIIDPETAKALIGREVTLSVLVRSAHSNNQFRLSLYDMTDDTMDKTVAWIIGADNWTVVSATFVMPSSYAEHVISAYITTSANYAGEGGGHSDILAVKLELGSHQTLAHKDASGNWVLNDPPPDKHMETIECCMSTADPSDTYANNRKTLAAVGAATASVTLAAGAWSGNTQTIAVPGVTADNTVICSPDPASHDAYGKYGVYCISQADGQLTFRCKRTPDTALAVNIIAMGG